MIIYVTKADIKEGRPTHPVYCPIARALKRQTGKPYHVNGAGIHLKSKYVPLAESDKSEVVRFQYAFDRYLPVAPFEFNLPL